MFTENACLVHMHSSNQENMRYTINDIHIRHVMIKADVYVFEQLSIYKLTEAIYKTSVAKVNLLDLFFGLNIFIILFFVDCRQTREITSQWACKEKLQEKDTCMWEIWNNLCI